MREYQITRALKAFDKTLFAKRVKVKLRRKDYDEEIHKDPFIYEDQMQILRKTKMYDLAWLDRSIYLLSSRERHDLVFALTDNWNITGTPVDWGIEPIMARIKAMDMWNRGLRDIIDTMDKETEKVEESKERNMKNNVESFLYDFKSEFAKATKDINTSQLKDPRWKKQKTRSY